MNNKLLYSLLLLVTTFFWGVTFPLIKVSLEYISPLPFLAFRFSVAAAILIPIVIRKKSDLIKKGNIIYGFWAGFYLMIGYVLQTIGLDYTSAAASGLITGLYVVILPLLSVVYMKVRVGRLVVFSSILAFSGLIIMSVGSFSGKLAWVGDLLTFLCALAYAFQLAYLSKHSYKIDTYVFSFYQLLIVGIFSFALIPFMPDEMIRFNSIVIFSIVFTAIFASTLAIFIMTRALSYVEPAFAGIIFVGEPIFAAISSVLFIGEKLSVYTITGGTIMVIAILIVTGSKYITERHNQVIPHS